MYLGFLCYQHSFSATIIDHLSGDVLQEATVKFDEDFPYRHTQNGHLQGSNSGEFHVDPQIWVEALDGLLDRLLEMGADLSAVTTISGLAAPSLIFLNEKWQESVSSLNPNVPLIDQLRSSYVTRISPISIDSSATKNAESIRSKLPRTTQIAQIIGSSLDSSKGAAQIHKFYSSSKEAWEQTKAIHVTSSFIQSILIGRSAPLELSDTAQLGLYDIKLADWHHDLLDCTAPNLKEKLPILTKCNKPSGKIADYFTYKYGFSDEVECFPWLSKDAATALGHGVFEPSSSLLNLGDRYDYTNYIKNLPEHIPNHATVSIHPMGGFLTKFTLNNGLTTFKQTIENLNLNLNRIESQLDALPTSGSLPTLPFLTKESDAIPAADQSEATLLSMTTGQILHLQLFCQWADENSTELTITGEGSALASLRLLCSNIFQLPTYYKPEKNNELIGTMTPYLISEHQPISAILKKLIRDDKNPETKPEPFMAGFYSNQLQEYFQLLTKHINQ
ncbi:MAG: FGGY family carbohydrate kinase [Akkermansiaceae bacterium]